MLSKRSHYSFTLVELLIAIVIIGILVSLGIMQYRKVIPKAKASKAKHALALIAEAEKMYRVDYGVYWPVVAGAVEATIGSGVTGMNLAAVDNDIDFTYSVNAADVISANNPAAIGACAAGTPITYDLLTGVITVPGCYE